MMEFNKEEHGPAFSREEDNVCLKELHPHLKGFYPLIKDGSIGIEIGCWRAWSTRLFLENTKLKYMYTVDAWSTSVYDKSREESSEYFNFNHYLVRYSDMIGSKDPKDFQNYYEKVYFFVLQKLIGQRDRVIVCRMSSKDFWNQWFSGNKSKVDWCHIDGSHSYVDVLNDLECSRKALKSGGYILGDDYRITAKSGVCRAVDEFCEKYGYTKTILPNSKQRFWIQV